MQSNVFSDLEGIRIAAEMEKRGGEFYRLAARACRAEETRALLNTLAADEAVHLGEFQRLYEREQSRAERTCYSQETGALLAAVAAEVAFPGGVVSMAHDLENPRAILNEAIRSEQDSIRFYGEMARATEDGQTLRVFEDIIRQERGHLSWLQRMLAETVGKD